MDVVIPDSVSTIGDSAFFGCSHLTSASIPDSVTVIGKQAFGFCSRRMNVTLPASLTYIDWEAFDWCPATFAVTSGSYAEQWCIDNGCEYISTEPAPDVDALIRMVLESVF